MADISDILGEVRDNSKAQEFVFKKAVNKGYYADTNAGKDLFIADLHESHAPGATTTPASPPVPGQAYTAKQLQLANLYKSAHEDNKSAAKGFKLTLVGAGTALILAIGSCFINDDKPRYHQGYPARRIEEPVDAKNTYEGIAIILGSSALIAAAYGITKKK